MKDNMSLKDMGGRKARKKIARNTPDLVKLTEAVNKAEHLFTHEAVQNGEYIPFIDDIWEAVDLTEELLGQYFDLMESPNNRYISSHLLTRISQRQHFSEEPVEFYYNGRGKEFGALFETPHMAGTVVVENIKVTHSFSRDFLYATSPTFMAINCENVMLRDGRGLVIIKGGNAFRNFHQGPVMAADCEIEYNLGYESKECLIDSCKADLDATGMMRQLPDIYCRGGLRIRYDPQLTPTQANHTAITGDIENIVLSKNMSEQEKEEVFGPRFTSDEAEFLKQYEKRKMYLLEELADCGRDRKIQIAREIAETYNE